jgi:AbrB family looped-hinge helix DNA binding protein
VKKYPKLLQTDARGQLVIPKEIRRALGITDGTGFWAYAIEKEGIFLKKIDAPPLAKNEELSELKEKAKDIGVNEKNIDAATKRYPKRNIDPMEDV